MSNWNGRKSTKCKKECQCVKKVCYWQLMKSSTSSCKIVTVDYVHCFFTTFTFLKSYCLEWKVYRSPACLLEKTKVSCFWNMQKFICFWSMQTKKLVFKQDITYMCEHMGLPCIDEVCEHRSTCCYKRPAATSQWCSR